MDVDTLADLICGAYDFKELQYKIYLHRRKEAEKEKAPTPVKESRPCSHATCGYEVGGRWDCEYAIDRY